MATFSDDDYQRDYELKQAGLERVLGSMAPLVGHAIIPYAIGGAVDMYYFPQPSGGTAFATMELLDPAGNGPKPSKIGAYELLAFTRHEFTDPSTSQFSAIERRMCGIFTMLGRYGESAVLNPGETCEVPCDDDEPNRCVIFCAHPTAHSFAVGERTHGLLHCLEVHPSEMEYARRQGTASLLERLAKAGIYPFSDLAREPVA